jgi:predicted DNA-binding protein
MPNPSITRSRQLKVTMTPDMHARLVALSQRLGQTPAALASTALSMYINQTESSLGATQKAVEAMVGSFTPDLARQVEHLMRGLQSTAEAPLLLEDGPSGPAGTVGVGS